MSIALQDLPAPAAVAADRARMPPLSLLLIPLLFVIWTQAQPFADFRNYAWFSPTDANLLRAAVTIGIAILFTIVVATNGRIASLTGFAAPAVVLLIGWCLATSALSEYRGLALNRIVLTAVTTYIAYCYVVLCGLRNILPVLSWGGLLVAVVSLVGIAFAPEVSIHSTADVTEMALAGDWRGVFSHKNDLAGMSACFLFLAVYCLRTRQALVGIAILVLAATLLYFSQGKSSQLLVFVAFALSALLVRLRSPVAIATVAIVGIFGPLAIVLGAALFPPVSEILRTVLPDATFTGRTDIWGLAMDAIGQRPLTGWGYSVFWDTRQTFDVSGFDSTAALVAHSHNGYLETAVSAGLPGLALALYFAFAQPLADIIRLRRAVTDRTGLAQLECLTQLWVFMLLLSCFEIILVQRQNPVWFCALIAIFALRRWQTSLSKP